MTGRAARGDPHLTVAGHDEAALLRRLLPHLPLSASTLLGPGDDAAVVAAPGARFVATTDLLVEGHDFRREWSSGVDVGWKAAVQNLADVAAMGAQPTGLLVALGMPGDTPLAWVEEFARGLGQACTAHGTGVAGGDLSGAPVIVVSITAFGDLGGRPAVQRDGARPGDVLALAGSVGRAAAGLALLRAGRPEAAPALVDAQRRPTPPLEAGPAAARAGASAMLDVSDGLGTDLARLAQASGVHLDVEATWVAEHTGGELLEAARALEADPAAARDLARSWLLGGGEDHALVAAFPAAAPLPAPFVRIGRVLEVRPSLPPVTSAGRDALAPGWDHFA